jgi:hypothetical protein
VKVFFFWILKRWPCSLDLTSWKMVMVGVHNFTPLHPWTFSFSFVLLLKLFKKFQALATLQCFPPSFYNLVLLLCFIVHCHMCSRFNFFENFLCIFCHTFKSFKLLQHHNVLLQVLEMVFLVVYFTVHGHISLQMKLS